MDRCRRCLCFCLSKNRLLLSESMDAKCINLTIMVVYIKHKERQRNFHLIVFFKFVIYVEKQHGSQQKK